MHPSVETGIQWLATELISVNPYQPRRRIQSEDLVALAESIRVHGIIQPVIVRPLARGYQLVAGERRLKAARLVGLERVPALVRSTSPEDSAVLALVENLQRKDLSYWDEAEGFFRLHHEFGQTQTQIALKMGLGQSTVANRMRILNLEPEIRQTIEDAGLSERHARVLLTLPRADDRRALVGLMVERDLTIREAEAWVAKRRDRDTAKPLSSSKRSRRTVVKDFRIVYNAFKKTLATVEDAGMTVEMSHLEDHECWEIRVRIPKNQEG